MSPAHVVPGATPDTRPVFVFQHGLGADAAQPAALVPSSSVFRVVTRECPGHGQSPAMANPSLANFADDVAQFAAREVGTLIESDVVQPWVLGGISMGAAIALRLACHWSGGVTDRHAPAPNALVLVRPAWLFNQAPPNMACFVELANALRQCGSVAGKTQFAHSRAFAAVQKVSPDNANSLLGQFDRPQAVADPAAAAKLLSSIALDGPGVTAERVSGVTLPTLVIGCADDVVHPLPMAQALADTLPHARFVDVPSKSRTPDQHADATRAAIGKFLGRVAARG